MSQQQAFRRVAVNPQAAQQLQVTTIPAPTRGLIQNENETFMQPGAAVVLDNWMPTMRGVALRGGCILHSDLHALDKRAFRTFLDNRNWLHPFDSHGRRQRYNALPKHVAKLEDDPFRSLAGAVRRAGGFAKVDTPYSEFLWADFFRRRIDRHEVEERFDDAVVHACEIANSKDASYLPGWAGIDD